MNYTVAEIADGRAKIIWPDDSFTYLELTTDMTEEEFDDAVYRIIPPHLKSGNGAPSFLSTGDRTAEEDAGADSFDDPRPEYVQNRVAAYGGWEQQLEYITENGLEAWQENVAAIKAANPKPSE